MYPKCPPVSISMMTCSIPACRVSLVCFEMAGLSLHVFCDNVERQLCLSSIILRSAHILLARKLLCRSVHCPTKRASFEVGVSCSHNPEMIPLYFGTHYPCINGREH